MSLQNRGAVTLVDPEGDSILGSTGSVKIQVESGGSEQFADNATVNPASKGNLVMGTDGSNYQILKTDSSGRLMVDVEAVTIGNINVDLTTADKVSIYGNTSAAGSGDAKALLTDADGHLQVDIQSIPTTAVTGTFWQATQPISGNISLIWSADGSAVKCAPAQSDSDPDLDGEMLLGTHSVVSGRSDANTIVGITALNGNHNALHMAITDGTEVVNVNSSNELEVEVKSISAGDNNIGNVDIASIAAGDNNIGNVDIASIAEGTNAIGKVGHDITGMVSEINDDVGTSAEDLRGAGTHPCKRVDMMADPSNTGYIWVGDSSVANDGTGGGIRLGPGDFYSVEVGTVNSLHVAATIASQKIMYSFFT